MKKARGGMMEEGGTYNERGKRATMAEIAAEGRRMEGRKAPIEGISTRPTDDSGRRITDAELGIARAKGMGAMTEGEARAKKKPMPKTMSDLERARMMVRPLPRKEGGGVPAHSDRPMKKNMGGGVNSKLSSMITQTKANMAAGPRAKSTFVDTMKKVGPQKPSSGNPLMGGMNRGDIVASKPTPVRGPSMAPAHSNRPMIRRAMGGLSAMPKGGKC
jgi:hypothetical protein